MAYDEYLVDRIGQALKGMGVNFTSKNMMGAHVFFVDEKMFCATHSDKKTRQNLLMARIGEVAYEKEIRKSVCLPMNFTGRPMKGYIYVTPEGMDLDQDLNYWLQLALDFNPLAKSSKRKKKA